MTATGIAEIFAEPASEKLGIFRSGEFGEALLQSFGQRGIGVWFRIHRGQRETADTTRSDTAREGFGISFGIEENDYRQVVVQQPQEVRCKPVVPSAVRDKTMTAHLPQPTA